MAQYIPKSALVAEIEKLKEENRPNSKSISEYIRGGIYGFDLAIEKTISIIDTLEAKEVDLEKECSKYFEENDLCVHDDYIKFARHFFELGIKAQKGK